MRIGVAALQGAVSEHVGAFKEALLTAGVKGEVIDVRRPSDLKRVDALALPGGESTTISKLLVKFELADPLIDRAEEGMPVMGTCAGCILLAKDGDFQVDSTETRLLGLMDMSVSRNAFGRQRESFEADIDIEGLSGGTFHAVFIRAPVIRKIWGKCMALSTIKDGDRERIVMARQDNVIAVSFHPELTGDTRIHRFFLEMI